MDYLIVPAVIVAWFLLTEVGIPRLRKRRSQTRADDALKQMHAEASKHFKNLVITKYRCDDGTGGMALLCDARGELLRRPK